MKVSLNINLTALDKSKIVERKYKNSEGVEVVEQVYKADLVELKEKKFVAEGPTWIMRKTHFLSDPQTREERLAKKKSNFIGEGFIFESKEQETTEQDVEESSENHNDNWGTLKSPNANMDNFNPPEEEIIDETKIPF
jgi:hypothetical protein